MTITVTDNGTVVWELEGGLSFKLTLREADPEELRNGDVRPVRPDPTGKPIISARFRFFDRLSPRYLKQITKDHVVFRPLEFLTKARFQFHMYIGMGVYGSMVDRFIGSADCVARVHGFDSTSEVGYFCLDVTREGWAGSPNFWSWLDPPDTEPDWVDLLDETERSTYSKDAREAVAKERVKGARALRDAKAVNRIEAGWTMREAEAVYRIEAARAMREAEVVNEIETARALRGVEAINEIEAVRTLLEAEAVNQIEAVRAQLEAEAVNQIEAMLEAGAMNRIEATFTQLEEETVYQIEAAWTRVKAETVNQIEAARALLETEAVNQTEPARTTRETETVNMIEATQTQLQTEAVNQTEAARAETNAVNQIEATQTQPETEAGSDSAMEFEDEPEDPDSDMPLGPTRPDWIKALQVGYTYNWSLTGQCFHDTDCAICLDRLIEGDKVTTIPCQALHRFHKDCIFSWLNVKNLCPLCRYYMPTTSHHY